MKALKYKILALKVISLLSVLLLPVYVGKFYLTAGIVWLITFLSGIRIIVIDGIGELFFLDFLLSLFAITGSFLIFSKKLFQFVLGYFLIYINLIYPLIVNPKYFFKAWYSVAVLVLFFLVSFWVIYLSKKATGSKK